MWYLLFLRALFHEQDIAFSVFFNLGEDISNHGLLK